ncbi:MAG: NADH-quinone oxidoreductase subunit NuoH [Gemmataceae bacterium]
MPEFSLLLTVITIALVMFVVLTVVAYLVMAERWLSAWMQDRIGPNRVGPFGMLQPLADGIKMFLKEDIIPDHVDRLFYVLAPGIAVTTALLAIAVVPFGATVPPPLPQPDVATYQQTLETYRAQVATSRAVIAPGVDIGILFAFAVTSLAVYGIILGGWSSNNKYSMLGSLRSSAQLISYEIPLGLSVLGVMLFSGSLNLETIIDDQVRHGWNILYQPLAFLLFLTGVFAECNRLPFDLPECESELVGGYHTEYSSMKFGLFFLAEYTHMITTSLMLSVLFLGGWSFPGLDHFTGWTGWAIKLGVVLAKLFFFIMVYMVVRWTILRFRFDQLMHLAWKVMIPLATLNVLAAMIVREFHGSRWWMLAASIALIIGWGFLEILTATGRINRPHRRLRSEIDGSLIPATTR